MATHLRTVVANSQNTFYLEIVVSAENVLMIFVKYPEPGKVKTRLAKTLGAKEAARLYRVMAEDVVKRLGTDAHGRYDTIIFFDPQDRASDIKNWLGNGRSYIPQSGLDLGEKLANAFRTVFDFGARRAVVIGTDCLSITGEIIAEALEKRSEFGYTEKEGTEREANLLLVRAKRFLDWVKQNVGA